MEIDTMKKKKTRENAVVPFNLSTFRRRLGGVLRRISKGKWMSTRYQRIVIKRFGSFVSIRLTTFD